MRKQSTFGKFINLYLHFTDRKSKYQERWFYSNPKNVAPPKKLDKYCFIHSERIGDRNLWFFEPKETKIECSIFFIHGGGFAKNFQSFHWRFIKRLCLRLNARIITPDYPLLPHVKYNHIHDHILQCYKRINTLSELSELYVIGDSCGATLALNSAHLLKEIGLNQPKEFILLSPWLDLSLSNPQINVINSSDPILDIQVLQKLGRKFSDNLSPNDKLISPIYQDLRRIAPITVFIGTKDIMLADCRKLRNLSETLPMLFNYREFNGMFHTWMYFDFPEGKIAREMIYNHILHNQSTFELEMNNNKLIYQ